MRFIPLLALTALLTRCKGDAVPPAPTPIPTLIEPEPMPSANANGFRGCNYDPAPVLVISSDSMLLDGMRVDDAALESALANIQSLNAMMGAPRKTDLVLSVEHGVSERRIVHVLSIATAAGFVNVTRLMPTEPHDKRRGAPPSARRKN